MKHIESVIIKLKAQYGLNLEYNEYMKTDKWVCDLKIGNADKCLLSGDDIQSGIRFKSISLDVARQQMFEELIKRGIEASNTLIYETNN